mgnify:CR=1 FL=1
MMDLEQFVKLMLVIIHKVFVSSFYFKIFLILKLRLIKNNEGVYVTSKVEYAKKYCQENLKVFVIGFVIVGNPFPVIEHPFMTNEEGKVILQDNKPKKNENGYLGKPINPGYQSHFTLGILYSFSIYSTI